MAYSTSPYSTQFVSGEFTVIDLVVEDVTHGTDSESLVLVGNIGSANSEIPIFSTQVKLVENSDLVIDLDEHTVYSDEVSIRQIHILVVDSNVHSFVSEEVEETQKHNLTVDGSKHILDSDVLELVRLQGPKILTSAGWRIRPIKIFQSGDWRTVPVKRWTGDTWEMV
jgi:hypothetical protein